jgi:hypothetical protein
VLRSHRVYKVMLSDTGAANSASRSLFGKRQTWEHQGVSLWCTQIRRTISVDMGPIIPARSRCWASLRQSRWARVRPNVTGHWDAIVTR